MNKVCKKLLLTLTAGVMALSAFSFASCDYSSKKLEGVVATDTVSSQGGWVVKKGGYVYFINGRVAKDTTTDDEGNEVELDTVYENEYGDAVRGALMRIKEEDMDEGDYSKVETVVPLLFMSDDMTSGFYIYGDRVYFATPSTAKNMAGEVEANFVDYKSAKLDGTGAMKDYYARSASSTRYRFVEVNGKVYLMYIDTDMNLYSIDTTTNKKTVLLRNASSCQFNASDLSDPYVYYTASVYQDVDKRYSATLPYNQVYRVRADATAELRGGTIKVTGYTDKYDDTVAPTKEETYTYEYKYDVASLKDVAKDAQDDTIYHDFSEGKIESYPIVNLGQLMIDGIGQRDFAAKTMWSHSDTTPSSLVGNTYALVSYKTIDDIETGEQKSVLFYTSTPVDKSGATGESAWAYMLDATSVPADNDAIKVNEPGEATLISKGAGKAGPASYYYLKNGQLNFVYSTGSAIYRAAIENGVEVNTLEVAKGTGVGVEKFLGIEYATEYDYVYYVNGSGGVARVVVDSDNGAEQGYYNSITGLPEYKIASVLASTGISYSNDSDWYAPEIVDGRLYVMNKNLFSDSGITLAEVVKIEGNNKELNEKNKKLEEVMDFFADSTVVASYNLSYYYFYNENTDLLDRVLEETIKDHNADILSAHQKQFLEGYKTRTGEMDVDNSTHIDFTTVLSDGDDYYGLRSYYFNTIGQLGYDEQEQLENVWRVSFFNAPAIDNERGAWTEVLNKITLGLVIALPCIAAITLTYVAVSYIVANGKAKKAGGSSNKKKYVVDMTDDETIDVYADENASNEEEKAEEYTYVEDDGSEE